VGDEQGGDLEPLLKAADLGSQLGANEGVERRQRLVEQQNRRLDRERTGDRDALLLPAGQLVRIPVGGLREPDQRQQLVGVLEARRLVLSMYL
jgi:hypothetical protein